MKQFELTVVSPERVTFQGEAQYVNLPAWEGSMGILPGHQKALVMLKEGEVLIRQDSGERIMAVSGGFVEVAARKVTIFAETAELAEEINEERARLAAARAKEDLDKVRHRKPGYQELDMARIEAELRRSLARLRVIESIGRRPKQH